MDPLKSLEKLNLEIAANTAMQGDAQRKIATLQDVIAARFEILEKIYRPILALLNTVPAPHPGIIDTIRIETVSIRFKISECETGIINNQSDVTVADECLVSLRRKEQKLRRDLPSLVEDAKQSLTKISGRTDRYASQIDSQTKNTDTQSDTGVSGPEDVDATPQKCESPSA